MRIYPAIDISGGACVRLFQGDFGQKTVYNSDPVAVAKDLKEKGAQRLHVVNLDGSVEGCITEDMKALIRGIKAASGVPLQFGGGIRTMEDLEAVFEAGADKAILGTSGALDTPFLEAVLARFGDKIVLSIDARDGYVATRGWLDTEKITAVELAEKAQRLGVAAVVHTDIARDGAMQGPNVEAYRKMREVYFGILIGSGGISKLEDLEALKAVGVEDAIVGKAIYEGALEIRRCEEV
jgi:phosphoribosylformimino-5-aminoimidazole carboxamide ribotide isomerase